MKRICLAAVFLLIAGDLARLPAQEPQQQPATITATSQEVLLDLVVRDKKGHLLKNLKPEEITVTDDGAPQQIRSLRLRTGAEISTVQTTTAAGGGGGSQTVVRKAPSGPVNPLRDVRVVTFAFDPLPGANANNERLNGANAGGGDRRILVKKVAEQLLQIDAGANFYWGVFLMGRGRINVVQPYTTDKDKLLAAVDKAIMSPGIVYAEQSDAVGQLAPVTSDVPAAPVTGAAGGAAAGAAGAAAAMAQLSQNMAEFELDTDRAQRGRDDFFALRGMIRELQRLPGRKTLVYFTKGLIMLPEFHSAFEELIASANRANVTIYCVDPAVASTGLGNNDQGLKIMSAAARSSASNMTKRGGPVTRDEATVIEHAEASISTNSHLATLQLAEDTGGFLIANLNDTDKIVNRLSEEINTYYELTYSPTIEKYDGHFRKIAVKVARPDVRVQSRSGYFALPYIPGQSVFSYEVPMLSALTASPAPKAVPFRAGVKFFGPTTAVVFDVPLKGITMIKDEAAKTFRCHLSLLGLIKDSQGVIVKKITRDVPVSNSLSNLDATLAGHFIYTQHVTLAPGKYTLETAVLDRESDKLLTGVKKQVLVVAQPAPSSDLSMSSLTLVRKLAPLDPDAIDLTDPFEFSGGKVTPELNESVQGGKGSSIGLYLIAYTQPEQDAKLVIDFIQDSKVVARSESALPKADGHGRIHYAANVPIDSLKPGQYELYAKVIQSGKGVQERMLVDIEQ
ncbi:MAG TPA: VWA domain-containing protein [Bryobacteraceae bacterium]